MLIREHTHDIIDDIFQDHPCRGQTEEAQDTAIPAVRDRAVLRSQKSQVRIDKTHYMSHQVEV